MVSTGLSAMSFYAPHRYVTLDTIAEHYGTDPEKFSKGIGQEKIALPGHDEDVVTMAAEAAKPIVERHGAHDIDTVLFATETGVDQSKSAGIFLQDLLGLRPNIRHIEFKQACYSGTGALQMACSYVARRPDRKVLVIASDIARYDLDSSGEATQGAGAIAMLVSADPELLEIGSVSGLYTEDIMDFWRPNDRRTPLFDGKLSALRYMNALVEAWRDYQAQGGAAYEDLDHFCYHLPFSRLGEKAHRHLAKEAKLGADMDKALTGMIYNRQVGNSYTASIYLAILSTLENSNENLTGNRFGLFSYGSGATAEFFDATVVDGYREKLFVDRHKKIFENREAVSYDDYIQLWQPVADTGDAVTTMPEQTSGRYRLTGIDEKKRIYVDRSG
ncbi:MAG: hydroxymethylglutaryl-CoA synthase [Pseudomonadota bacterium]